MEIRMGSLARDARDTTGTAIIIDVFRAFTTAAIAFDRGGDADYAGGRGSYPNPPRGIRSLQKLTKVG